MKYDEYILKGILKNTENLLYCIERVEDGYFDNKIVKIIYKILKSYYKKYYGVIDPETFSNWIDKVRTRNEEEKNEIKFCFDSFYNKKFDFAKFKYCIDQVIKRNRDKFLDKKLIEVGNFHRGEKIDESIESLKEIVTGIDKFGTDLRPEGDILSKKYVDKIKTKMDAKIKLYKDGKLKELDGINCGISKIDEHTNGIKKHDFWLWVGYTGEGKTMMLKEFVYNAAFVQGKNVVVITLEMSDEDWCKLIYCRHSHKFYKNDKGYSGIEYRLIRDRPYEMTPDQKRAYNKTLDDIEKGKDSGKYGQLYVFFPESSYTLSDLEMKLNELQKQFKIDLLVIDYISIMSPNYMKGHDPKKSFGQMFIDAKQLAQNFNNGQGLPVLAAHQTNRKGWEEARKRGYYVKSDLADTSEAEKNSSLVGYILQTEQSVKDSEIILGIMKYRFGRNGGPWRTIDCLDKCLVGDTIKETFEDI